MIYPRKLKQNILKEIDNDMVIVITGMRRVGKTFLLRDIFNTVQAKNSLFLDLEKPENLALFKEESYDAVITNLGVVGVRLVPKTLGEKTKPERRAFIFLDEIQVLKTIPSIIKYLADHYQVKFIVSGSSSFYLKNLFGESLSGRKVIFNLYPLDFGEFLIFRGVYDGPFVASFPELKNLNTEMIALKFSRHFDDYLKTGGFPQVVLENDSQRKNRLLLDILHSYLTIDVRTLSDFKGIDDLEKLIKVLPPRVGQKVDISKLASEIGISRATVKNYLTFLEDTFVISLIYPYVKSPDREISAVPKLYFGDVGLGSALWNMSDGQKLENVAYSHLHKKYEVNYYRRKSGVEVDFIADRTIGIEVKSFGTISDVKKLNRIAESLGLSDSFVLTHKVGERNSKGVLPAFLLGFLQ